MNRVQGYDFNDGQFNSHQPIIENNPNDHSFDLWTKPDDFGFGINHDHEYINSPLANMIHENAASQGLSLPVLESDFTVLPEFDSNIGDLIHG